MSCMIECMKAGTASPDFIKMEKIRKSLLHNSKLQEMISVQIRDFGEVLLYEIEKERFEKVFRKLTIGHLVYDNVTLRGKVLILSASSYCLRCQTRRENVSFVLIGVIIGVNYCQKYAVMVWNI